MLNRITIIEHAKTILHTPKRYATRMLSAAVPTERITQKSKRTEILQTNNLRNKFNKFWDKTKNFYHKIKLKQKLPQGYTPEMLEQSVDATLEKYLECYTSPKKMSMKKFKTGIRTKLNKFYIEEAQKAEEILTKNKDVFEELDRNYQEQLNRIVREARSRNGSKKENYRHYITEKLKIDKEFGDKILDIFSREYGLEGIRPTLECCRKMDGATIGGWNAFYGKIVIRSSLFDSSAAFINTLFHEYTHFLQTVDLYKTVGKTGFIKLEAAKLTKKLLSEGKSVNSKFVAKFIYKYITNNPLYQKLEIYAQQHPNKLKGIRKNLTEMQMIEQFDYKNTENSSFAEYANQLLELHAHHNGNYIKELYKQLFPNYASAQKARKIN